MKDVKDEMKGSYTCKVKNEYGESKCRADFVVQTKPKLLKKLADQRIKEGDTLKLTVEISGTPDPEIKWYKDGQEVSADARIKITRDKQRKESYDLTVTLVKGSDGGAYEVRAENELGMVLSKSKVIVLSKILQLVIPTLLQKHTKKKNTILQNTEALLCPELSNLFSILEIGRHDNALAKLTRIYQTISSLIYFEKKKKEKKIVLSAQQRSRLSSKHARDTRTRIKFFIFREFWR